MSLENQSMEQRVEAQIQDDLRDIQDVEQQRQITQFVDEEKEVSKTYDQNVKVVRDPYINQDLVGFLSRPYPVATIAWKHASTRGACIGRYVFPDMSFKVNALWKKLQQFQYFRAGICFTIKVNASAYHYGKLLCVWRPLALGKTSNDIVLGGPAAAYDNLYTLSSFPHVVVNANSCESIDFYVDYSLPYDWIDLSVWSEYNISRKMMNMGILEFWVLNPLYAMGQPTDPDAVITLFAAFTNPEVAGYTSQEYIYTDIGFFNGYKTMVMPNSFSYNQQLVKDDHKGDVKNEEKSKAEEILLRSLPKVQALEERLTHEEEMVVERILEIMRKQADYIDQTEFRKEKKKRTIRKFFSDAFACLPLAQSGGDAGNNTMNVKEGVYKITQFPMQIASTHVDHAAIPLSLFQDVSCISQASNSTFSFLSKPCLLHQFDITKTGKWGDSLMAIPVSPMWYPVGSYESVSKKAKFLTRVAMYARLFEMWRGTLRYHFNIVCSRFHSLRIRVYWMPGNEADEFKIFMASNAVNKVIDIEGSTDFYVDVPWLNRLDFLRTREDDGSNNGFLYMDLLNPIVYPEATMPPVQVNVWVSAGPDFEVELLKKKISYMALPSWKKSAKDKEAEGIPKAQAGEEISSGPILGVDSKIQMPKIIGERTTTLQDLITKPVPFHRFTQGQNELSYVPNAREARIEGGIFFYSNSSLYDYFAVCFGAISGSVRFHSVSLKSGTIGFLPEVNNGIVYYRGKSGLFSIDDFLNQNGYTSGVVFDNSTLLRTVTLPFYCNSKYIPITFSGMEADLPQDLIYPMARVMVFAAADGSMLYASASENFYYHLPMGVPLMID